MWIWSNYLLLIYRLHQSCSITAVKYLNSTNQNVKCKNERPIRSLIILAFTNKRREKLQDWKVPTCEYRDQTIGIIGMEHKISHLRSNSYQIVSKESSAQIEWGQFFFRLSSALCRHKLISNKWMTKPLKNIYKL